MPDEVTFQLNSVEAKWLDQQREFCSEALVEIITGALLGWVARHSDRFINQENLTDILRQALDEFISRHKDEFL